MLRHLTLAVVTGIAVVATIGCTTTYVNDPLIRQDQLLEQSEDVRDLGEKWYRGCDHPVEMQNDQTLVRVHGGIL